MNDEVVFYYNPMSRSRTVLWMLEETGAPYRVELVNFTTGEHKKPAFLAVNPMGKLPAIVHRGVVVTETSAICAYLADAYPAARLAPALTEPVRGSYLRWMFFAAACLEPAHMDRMLERPPVSRTTALGYGTYEDVMRVVEAALTPGPWLLGRQFSAADVYLGNQLRFGQMMKSIEPRPVFLAYLGRLTQRPAYQRAEEINGRYIAQLKAAS
ncbi:MAG: glutathione S-transferase family protein [Proteobacteria bacterium]|nr:glutathione S-transferase family protein [Pseudomonadota bacterium]